MLAIVTTFAADAAKEESSNFLVSPDVGLMIWTLIAFLVALFILRKWAWPAITEALDKRQRAIEESIETAETARVEAAELLEEYRARLREARAQADEIVARARKAGEVSERVRSATSIDSSIARWRLSSASVIAGHAYLRSTNSATRKASRVQIISPTSGLTRKLLDSSVVVVWARTSIG